MQLSIIRHIKKNSNLTHMFSLFKQNSKQNHSISTPAVSRSSDFGYLSDSDFYFDSACQTLRPQSTIDAINEYYTQYNACGHRVQYKWGKKVDHAIEQARELVLERCGKSSKEYTVAFTNNATMGINLVLHQLNPQLFSSIVTTAHEHSSVMIPSMTVAQNNNWNRVVVDRDSEYNLPTESIESNSVYIFNTTNNYDGQSMEYTQLNELTQRVQGSGGIVLIDACQTFGHHPHILQKSPFDACFVSFHKSYGPSLGAIVIKKSLAKSLKYSFLGGSTISNNDAHSFDLITQDDELFAPLEPGLQDYAAITGLVTTLKWLKNWKSSIGMNQVEYEHYLAQLLWSGVQDIPQFKWINTGASSILSGYSEKDDGNRIAMFLSQKNIMVRSGYHCVYNYLIHQKKYPPLFRISLGLHNTESDIEYLIKTLKFIASTQ